MADQAALLRLADHRLMHEHKARQWNHLQGRGKPFSRVTQLAQFFFQTGEKPALHDMSEGARHRSVGHAARRSAQ